MTAKEMWVLIVVGFVFACIGMALSLLPMYLLRKATAPPCRCGHPLNRHLRDGGGGCLEEPDGRECPCEAYAP